MRDITTKTNTLRTALASGIISMKPETVTAVQNNTTEPKKDVLAVARASGYIGVKNTSQNIPHCHPVPVESVQIDYEFEEDSIKVWAEVKTIYKTGCEMEALQGVSGVLLTIYDMLKPMDESLEIGTMKLEEKKGGKSDYKDLTPHTIATGIVIISDSVCAGKKDDRAGAAIREKLETYPDLDIRSHIAIPDEPEEIRRTVRDLIDKGCEFIITTGGTGLSPRDQTPEALQDMLDREIPGIMEAARDYGQQRTPYSMLSRGIAGLIHKTLVLTLPGSTNGAKESMEALFPGILHIFKVLEKGYQHQEFESNKQEATYQTSGQK